MQSGHRVIVVALLLGALLLAHILPAGAQAPEPSPNLPQILALDRKLCPICKKAEMIIQEVQNRYPGQFTVRRVYIDEHLNTFRQYGVAIVPTQVFLDAAGREVFRHEGVFSQDKLVQKLRELKFIQDAKK
jgi:thioredoxin 1